MEKSLEKDMEREQLIGKYVRQKLETRSVGKLKHTLPNRSHHPGKGSRAVVGTQGSAWGCGYRGSQHTPASWSSYTASFSQWRWGTYIQGQEDVGEKILQCGGALYGERKRESAAGTSAGALEE